MKKLLFIIMGTLLLTAACGNNEQPADKKDAAVENNASETSEVAKFPEYSIVKEYIPNATYKESLESDNDDERVILFENADGKSFKSFYLKTRNILQIRDLEEDRLTYNKIFRPEK
ncbi:hypothetical protein ACFFF5_08070 [Lederbergia wuyishanensis]|uniref:Protein involved in sex pheromone biosynthesis n=1 Tax=Lederbergia wuyishanensis TaxID=1347903 RepID=A0ABU0D6I4_9BACI|nr:hypothetical protein [Lederbergia wuyishanensis]MCJ8008559.1 hypothetical protein [Lederbergia wuyishanensis]MDQ0344027.1 protein involved in sex pheromone biosynthesis [Lederbergia wuyishanensis]